MTSSWGLPRDDVAGARTPGDFRIVYAYTIYDLSSRSLFWIGTRLRCAIL
jgi:hypothetical protein